MTSIERKENGTIIISYKSGKAEVCNSLLSALGLRHRKAPIVSVIGGGGKTSLIKRLALEYEEQQQSAIVTTTTKMKVPKTDCFLKTPDMRCLADLIKRRKAVWMGNTEGDGKIRPFPMAFLEAARLLQVPMLIEADGSNRLPCKVPTEHEPALWGKSTVAIGVIGLDAIGKTIKDVCHRPEQAERLLGKSKNERLTCEDVVTIGLSTKGMKKSTDPFMDFSIVLNKADDERRMESGEEVVRLFSEKGFKSVLITANLMGEEEWKKELRSEYAVVALAAGMGSRFGGNKLLYPVNGKAMYRHLLEVLVACTPMTKVIVTGQPEIMEAAAKEGVYVAENLEPELGISHSIKLGVAEAKRYNPALDGILFTVCDQPGLTRDTIYKMVFIASENRGKIVCASQNGKSRNPVVWDKAYLEELCTLSGDVGGRQLMNKYEECIVHVEVDEQELKDIDKKEDLLMD